MSKHSGFLKKFSWLLLADLFSRVSGFLAMTHIARALSPAGFGVIGYGLALAGFFMLIVDGGVAVAGSMEVSRQPERHSALVAHFLFAKLLFAFCCFPVFLGLCYLTTSLPEYRLVLMLSGLILWTSCLRLDWFFVGTGATYVPAAGIFLSQTVFTVAVYLLVRTEADIMRVPLIGAASEVLAAGVIAWHFSSRVGLRDIKIDASRLTGILKTCWPLVSMQLLRYLSFTFDTVFIGFVLSWQAVGIYLAIYRVIFAIIGIGGVYFQILLPTMAKEVQEGTVKSREMLEKSLFWTAIIVIPCAIGIAMTASPLILLIFGSAYTAGALPLRILAFSAVFVVLNGNFRQILIAADRQPLVLRLAAVTAFVNIVLNVLLILRYGIEGAAAAAMASEFLFLVMTYLCLRRTAFKIAFWRPVLPALMMSLLMAAIVLPITQGELWPSIGLSAAVYAALYILASRVQKWSGWPLLAYDCLPGAQRWLQDNLRSRRERRSAS